VTANADRSTLPLSRVCSCRCWNGSPISTGAATPDFGRFGKAPWLPQAQLDAFEAAGTKRAAQAGRCRRVDCRRHCRARDLPTGLYANDDARIAVEYRRADTTLSTANGLSDYRRRTGSSRGNAVQGWLLALRYLMLMLDCDCLSRRWWRLRGPACGCSQRWRCWCAAVGTYARYGRGRGMR